MALPIKTTVTQIVNANILDEVFGNTPHDDLETNIDSILTYLSTYPFDYIGSNTGGITGLTFAYHTGIIRYNNTTISVAGSTILLIANETNYVEVDNTGTVSSNISSFTIGKIPLWVVVSDATDILSWADARNWNKIITEYAGDITIAGNVTINGVDNIIGDSASGKLIMNALTGTVYIANNSGNGQLIIQDGAAGTTNQVILNGTTGSITVSGNTVWNAGNDGTGSGLDADLLDGLNSTQILRTDVNTTTTGTITIDRASDANLLIGKDYSGTNNLTLKTDSASGNDFVFLANISTVDQTASILRFDTAIPEWQIGTDKIWHAGNDGTGSGLDADLLKGKEGYEYSGLKVNASDLSLGYLVNKLQSNTIDFAVTGSGPYTLTANVMGPTYISTVTVMSGNYAWTTYSLINWVPAGTKFILVESDMEHGIQADGDQWYAYARKDSGSSTLQIGRIYMNYDNNKYVMESRLNGKHVNQCFLPITTNRTVDISAVLGDNRRYALRLIGYW